ncbi:RhuM family protein [Phascolarctobacterium succinatutens]|uniref:RhuM family protein n=1 Tax=Phascolarctobacterium succinatutens TaxID=626940 RepID=UPI0026F0AD24|nr:RhuM family protein [Phascolarctobacterium succinatutens]
MADIIIYNTADGKAAIKLYADNGTVWLTQAQIAELFTKNISTISRHIANIFDENEIEEKSNLRFMQIANSDKPVAFYSLDVILAVGFRVRSPRGTQFRQWANNTLKEYLQKGFILDKDRLKNPDGRPDYFDELLEQIRDIRASEKRFYQKLRDLFALSSDYKVTEKATQLFFADTQNKLLFGVTKKTAAEIIDTRANADAQNMALTSWSGSIVRKADVIVAKNYLTSDEIDVLNRLVTIFLESAELHVKMRKDLTLDFWRASVDKLLLDHGVPLLQSHGKITMEQAQAHARKVYEEFDARRKAFDAAQADEFDLLELEQETKNIKK